LEANEFICKSIFNPFTACEVYENGDGVSREMTERLNGLLINNYVEIAPNG
jgi:hypothetical protein